MKNAPTGALNRASLLACATLCATSTVQAQSGTWTGTTSFGLWNDTANWAGGTVADGAGSTANFSTLDLPEGVFTVALNTPRTIGSLTFGDTDIATAGSWLIDNNADPLNILTLSGTPVITVNGLGTLAQAEISAVISGTENLSKAGAGTLALSGANTYSGGTTLNTGTLAINGATAIGTGPLAINGGALDNTSFAAVTLSSNNAQTWNSNIVFAGTNNLNLGTGAVATGGVLREVTTTAGILTVGGVITSPAGLTKSGAGQLSLNGNNLTTINGPRLLKAGTVTLGGGQANVQNAFGDAAGTLTFEGGTLVLNGSTGNFNSTTWGTFANPIAVASGQTGTLRCHPRGSLTSAVSGAGTLNLGIRDTRLDFNANLSAFTGNLNVSSTIAPSFGDLRVNGTGQFATTKLHLGASVYMAQIFNPTSSGTLTTTQNIGGLSGDVGSVLAGQPVNGRYVNWVIGALNTNTTFAGVIQNGTGACRIVKVGTGTLTLAGNNTYTGNSAGVAGTQVTAGTLAIGEGGASGSLGNTDAAVSAGATLVFNRDNTSTSTYPGILSGAGNVIKRGTGQVNFHGLNTYTAGTTIEGGIIGINSASSLGNAAGAVNFTTADGGVLATVPGVLEARPFNVASGLTASFGGTTAADSLEITSTISGAGSLAVGGSGVLTLSAANGYAGTTTVASGALVATNPSGSATATGAVAVSGGTLAGTGTITGAVTVGSSSSLKPGSLTPSSSGVGNLTVGTLDLAGGSTLHTEFTDATTYDQVIVTGTNGLTASASLANPVMVDLRVVNSSAKWTTPGTYTIAQFAGTFSGNANDLFEVTAASQQVGQTYTFAVAGNNLQLTIGGNLPSIWNVDASGNWTVAGNWLNGPPNAIGATAQFGSAITAPRTVTLDAARTVGVLAFNNANAYTIGGSSTLTLNQTSGNADLDVLAGSHAISAPILLTDSVEIDLFNPANSLSLLGNISGASGIVKSSPGHLTLGGTNSFLGDLSFANGTLTFSNGSLGAGNLTLDNASLAWASGNTQDITAGRAVVFGDNPVTFAMDDNVTLANDFGGIGLANLVKDGFGTLTLTADTGFSGNVTVANGNLTLGNGGATGSLLGNIGLANVSSVLTTNLSGDHTIGNLITGAGSLVLNGTGVHALTQANTFSGTTTINAGTAYLGNSMALQNSTLSYMNGGGSLDFGLNFVATLGALEGDKNLVLESSDVVPGAVTLTAGGNGASTTYSGILSGVGSFTKAGTGTMVMSGAHTYSGGTQVNAGILELDPTVTLNNTTVNVAAFGRLTSNGATITASTLSNVANGAFLDLFGGSVSYAGGLNGLGNGNNTYHIQAATGTSLSVAGMGLGRSSLIFGTEPTAGSANDGLLVTGGDVDINGSLLLGNVSGANSSVSTQITAGSLDVTGPVSVGLNNGGRWSVIDVAGGTFTSTDTATGVRLGGPFVGNAAFLARGGVATVERFQFGNAALGGSSTVHVSDGELYVGSGGMVIGTTEPGFVATVRLTGGTLGAKAAWSTALPVVTGNSFTIKAADASNAAQDITLSGAVSDDSNVNTAPGALVKEGAGTLTLSGTYSYSGNTDVNAGTLALGTGTLSDTGTVNVATGATLHLNFAGSDTVAGFSIDGVPQADGTWGAVGSGAQHESPRLTGTGLLVVPPSDPFVGWIAGFDVGAQSAKTDDPDGDGLTNLDEFALNGDPASGTPSGKVRTRIETVGADQVLVITLPVRNGATFDNQPGPAADATIDDLAYTIAGSNNLSVFDQAVTEIAASTTGMPNLDSGWTYHSFRLNGAIGGVTPRGPRGFLRATVADAP